MDTQCNECCFLNDNSCDLGIHDVMPEKLKKEKGKYTLVDFECMYGFGKKTYEENKYLMSFDDLKSSVLERNQMTYVLYIDKPDYVFDLEEVSDYLDAIEYQPAALCIVSYNQISKKILDEFQLKCNIPWKVVFPHVESSKYDTLIGAFNSYLKFNPDLFVMRDFYDNYEEIINSIHIEHVINKTKESVICLNDQMDNIYIPKECFFADDHNWKDLINKPKQYLSSITNKVIL